MDDTPEELRARIARLLRLAGGVTDRQVKDAIAKRIMDLEQRLPRLPTARDRAPGKIGSPRRMSRVHHRRGQTASQNDPGRGENSEERRGLLGGR